MELFHETLLEAVRMARKPNPVPAYLKHQSSGKARIRVLRSDGSRQDVILPGLFGSPESVAEYARIVSLLQANGGRLPDKQDAKADCTIAELVSKFTREHVEIHYRHPDGTFTSEHRDFLLTLRPLVRLFSTKLASEFTPLDLRIYRDAIISGSWMTAAERETLRRDCGKDGTVGRRTTNQRVGRVKRLFRWAVSFALIPPTVSHALECVAGLQPGRSDARENPPVEAVPIEDFEATLPFLPEVVADLCKVQLACGCRAGEIVLMRTADIDQNGPGGTWVYRPTSHKNRWRGHARQIVLGPKSQLILRRYLNPEAPETFLFRPVESVRGKKRCKQTVADESFKSSYDVSTLDKCIRRACGKAGVPSWSTHQLRHLAARIAEREMSLEGARALLGHKSANLSAMYSGLDLKAAAEVANRVG